MKNSSFWKSWAQVRSDTKERTVYLYGRSEDWVHKAVSGFGGSLKGIIDREPEYHGTTYQGLPVFPIEEIEHNKDSYFIITSGDFGGIVECLEGLGYSSGTDFSCSPDFRDYEALERLKQFNKQVLVSSSDYNDRSRSRSSWLGGGLYIVDPQTCEFERKVTGSFRQFQTLADGRIAAVEYVDKKLLIINADYSIDHSIELDLPNYCGLSACDQSDNVTILNAGTDEILTFDSTNWKILNRRKFRANANNHSHHLNDCVYHDGDLYCSYFSFSGSYKINVFDGGVACLNPLSDDDPHPLLTGLWKPHSPHFFDGTLHILDSMTGKLVTGKSNFQVKFPGFVRGLDKHLQYYAVGQSEDMYVSERANYETVMLNAGFFIYDVEFNASRFVPMNGLMNIHDLLILDK